MMSATASMTTPKTTPRIKNVVCHESLPRRTVTRGLKSMAPMPKPMSMPPDAMPCLSGYHLTATLMTQSVPTPTPKPTVMP